MKFKSKVHFLNLLVHILIILVVLGLELLAFLNMSEATGLNMIFYALMTFVGVYVVFIVGKPLFNTSYLLSDNKLTVTFGNKVTEIKYIHVLSIKKIRKYFTLNTLSINKFEITYVDGNAKSTIYVSPRNEDEFLKIMKTNCKSMKVHKD